MLSKGVSSLVFCAVSGFLNQWKVCEPGSFPCWIAGQNCRMSPQMQRCWRGYLGRLRPWGWLKFSYVRIGSTPGMIWIVVSCVILDDLESWCWNSDHIFIITWIYHLLVKLLVKHLGSLNSDQQIMNRVIHGILGFDGSGGKPNMNASGPVRLLLWWSKGPGSKGGPRVVSNMAPFF